MLFYRASVSDPDPAVSADTVDRRGFWKERFLVSFDWTDHRSASGPDVLHLQPLHVPYLTAAMLVVGEFVITGAMHADGLMDTCDGLFSGRSRERMLEIMKDSCVGSFGLLAFVFLVLLKTCALAEAGISCIRC